jgi:hypothetical protein
MASTKLGGSRRVAYGARVSLRSLVWLLGLFGTLVVHSGARAAELRWLAPDACASRTRVAAEVERLLGRPLGTIEGMDFDVLLRHLGPDAVGVELRTTRRANAESRTRTLSASSCDEAADVAAVAIAMAATAEGAAEPTPPAPAPAPPAQKATPAAAASPSQPASPWELDLGAYGLFDQAALPKPTAGLEIDASVRYRALRVRLSGGGLLPRIERVGGEKHGGEFTLFWGAVLVCGERALQSFRLGLCGGFELGRIKAEGIGVSDPRVGAALWRAARAELVGSWQPSTGFRLALHAGLAIPTARPTFVLDGSETVHHVAPISVRVLLGGEFVL